MSFIQNTIVNTSYPIKVELGESTNITLSNNKIIIEMHNRIEYMWLKWSITLEEMNPERRTEPSSS